MLESDGGKDAVFSHQGNDVRNRANRNEIHIFQGVFRAIYAESLIDRHEQLVSHAHSGEMMERIAAIGNLGVDRRQCRRQFILGIVVVCDDDLHAGFTHSLNLFQRIHATIHAHNEFAAFFFDLLQTARRKPISVDHPVWDIIIDMSTDALESEIQKRSSSRAVHIIIAIYCNEFLIINRAQNPLNCGAHFLEKKGIEQVF